MFKNIKLSTRLISGFGVILVLLLGVTSLYHFAINSSCTNFSGLMDTQIAMANHAGEVESYMLQCRRNEKDFLLRKDLKYLGKLEDNVGKLKTEAESIATLAQASGDDQAADRAAEITTCADEYANDFKELIDAWETKGLDHKSGLQGQFRATAHNMAATTEEHSVEDLYVAMLMMRRYEKDFMRTKSDKYEDKFTTAIDVYQQLLDESSCDKTARSAQKKALNAYKDAFSRYLAAGESQELQDECYELMRSTAHESEEALNGVYVPDVGALVLDVRKNEKDYLLRGDEKYVQSTHKSIENLLKAFEAAGVLQDHIDDMKSLANDYTKAFDALVAEDGRIVSVTAKMRAAVHKIEPLVEATHSAAMESASTKTEATISNANSLAAMAISIAISAMVMGVAVAVTLTRSITRPFQNIFKGLKTFSTAELQETGMNFRQIIADLSAGGRQIAQSSQSLAEGSTEQAAGMEETSSSLEEMASMTNQNADNAQQANRLASEARRAANSGTESMVKMNDAIQEIQKSSDETAKIIKVIDEIAFQTNLLALNAAVEAARAGEAGKGFAVVAEEVRNLAMRSAEAAKNTANMIEESVKNSGNGVDIANEVAKVLEEIVTCVGKTTDLVGEIATASQEQAQGIEQVNTAIAQMDKVTQQNAAQAEESASASEQVMSVVNSLMQLVEDSSSSHNSSTRTGGQTRRGTAARGHGLKATDSAFHQIAQAVPEHNQGLQLKALAQKEIPLQDDKGMDDFNR